MTTETTPLLFEASANGALEDGIETIPPTHDGGYRTLVLLFDGTGDT